MSLKEVKPGNYKATIKEGAWIPASDKHKASIGIAFQFEREPGKMETITHFLYLSDAARSYTMDKLVELGYNFDKELATDEDGNKVFTPEFFAVKEVELVLKNEEYEGKTRLKVEWINLPGGMEMKGATVKEAMGNIDLRSEVEAAKARLAAKGRKAPPPAAMEDMPSFPSPAANSAAPF